MFLFGIAQMLCISSDETFFRYGLFLLDYLIKEYNIEKAKNLINHLKIVKRL